MDYITIKTIKNKLNPSLRKHRIISLSGDGKYIFNPANVTPNIYAAVKKLSSTYDIIIGGSVVLKLYNLVDRNPKDIDIIVSSDVFEQIKKDFEVVTNEDEYKCKKFIIDGISVDVFIDDSNKDYIEKSNMKLDTLHSIVKAKMKYGRDKDYKDFKYIIECIDGFKFLEDISFKSPGIKIREVDISFSYSSISTASTSTIGMYRV